MPVPSRLLQSPVGRMRSNGLLLLTGACAVAACLVARDASLADGLPGSAPLSGSPRSPLPIAVLATPVSAVVPVPPLFPQEVPPAGPDAKPDATPDEPKEPAPAGLPRAVVDPADPAVDVRRLEERMIALIPSVRAMPDTRGLLGAADVTKMRDELIRQRRVWESDVETLSNAADAYAKAVGPDGGDGRALFAAGLGKANHADISPAATALTMRTFAADLLERSLAKAAPDADYRGDAEAALARAKLFLVPSGRATAEQVAAHTTAAVNLLRKDGRAEEAGPVLALSLEVLVRSSRLVAAAGIVDGTEAATVDFGPSTDTIRTLVNAVRTGVGAPLPALPDGVDQDGKPVHWPAYEGKVLVIHFFAAGQPTGYPTGQRDGETVVRPLYDDLHLRGLEMVGVSMDWEMPPEKVAQVKANWDEWGVKHALCDGSAATVRTFADAQGFVWPWVRSGQWMNDPTSKVLGGCGRSRAHAVLVDRGGVIRWRGDAPFVGLAEEAKKLLPATDTK